MRIVDLQHRIQNEAMKTLHFAVAYDKSKQAREILELLNTHGDGVELTTDEGAMIKRYHTEMCVLRERHYLSPLSTTVRRRCQLLYWNLAKILDGIDATDKSLSQQEAMMVFNLRDRSRRFALHHVDDLMPTTLAEIKLITRLTTWKPAIVQQIDYHLKIGEYPMTPKPSRTSEIGQPEYVWVDKHLTRTDVSLSYKPENHDKYYLLEPWSGMDTPYLFQFGSSRLTQLDRSFGSSITSLSLFSLPKELKRDWLRQLPEQMPDINLSYTTSYYDLLEHGFVLKSYNPIVPKAWMKSLEKKGVIYAYGWDSMYFTGHYKNVVEIRTRMRESYGEYKSVPLDFNRAPGTGVHVSTLDPTSIAYYPTIREVKRDVPVKGRPGKYLRKYFPDLTDDDIRVMCGPFGRGELVFYTRVEDMIKAYLDLSDNGTVSSCMSKGYHYWSDRHPLNVYDESDVMLAVMNVNGTPRARALINKVTKEYPIIYGQWERMEPLLSAAGYKHGSLEGARINKIECRGGFVMAYIDAHRKHDRSHNRHAFVEDMGDHWVIVDEEPGYDSCYYEANCHESGVLHMPDTFTCECCGDEHSEDEQVYWSIGELTVCEYCDNEYGVDVYVRGTSHQQRGHYENDDLIRIDGEYFENDEAAEYHGYRYSEYEDEWYSETDLAYSEWHQGYILADSAVEVEDSDGCTDWVMPSDVDAFNERQEERRAS